MTRWSGYFGSIMFCTAAAALIGCRGESSGLAMDTSVAYAKTTSPLGEQYASADVVLPDAHTPVSPASAMTVTPSDIIRWNRHGLSDEQILDRLDERGAVCHLTTSDELRLRDAGIGSDVIRSLKASAWKE